jgi:hypothetical protein
MAIEQINLEQRGKDDAAELDGRDGARRLAYKGN